jgi:hypothetical protein
MENETPNKPRTRELVGAYAIIGLAAFGAYHVGKLGIDWYEAAVEIRKLKKEESTIED